LGTTEYVLPEDGDRNHTPKCCVLNKNRTMDNFQKHNICINVPSSQNFRALLKFLCHAEIDLANRTWLPFLKFLSNVLTSFGISNACAFICHLKIADTRTPVGLLLFDLRECLH
jgi:hypothetical protein